jgi:hypothetical protein
VTTVFGLFRKPTRIDPLFGELKKVHGLWCGALKTKLFSGKLMAVQLQANSDEDFAFHQQHLKLIEGNAATVRAQIAVQLFETYQLYKAEDATEPYRDLDSPEQIWPMLQMVYYWRFRVPHPEAIHHSSIPIEFDWPNPHQLVLYFKNDRLEWVGVEG